MVKRNFAALFALAMLGSSFGTSFAAPAGKPGQNFGPFPVDGCAKLARVVYSEVSAAALYGPGTSGPWVIGGEGIDIEICTHAAMTVSRAFTSAMNNAGYSVSWDRGPADPGDYCDSGFLSQCYPNRTGDPSISFTANSPFVQKSWAIVSQSVMRQMYNPFSSDEVRFRDGELKLQIGLSLRSIRARDGTREFID